MFPVGQPDDASEPVRGAVFVRDFKLLESKDAALSSGKVKQSRASHTTDAHHNRVE
jgi:hypothetical protein